MRLFVIFEQPLRLCKRHGGGARPSGRVGQDGTGSSERGRTGAGDAGNGRVRIGAVLLRYRTAVVATAPAPAPGRLGLVPALSPARRYREGWRS